MKSTARCAALVAAFCTATASSSSFADEMIGADTQLSADMTVNGTLYLANGATLDLNGHNLSVNALAISGYEDVPGYKFIDFLQTTSSGKQWINTEYTPACSDRVEMKVRYMPIGSTFQTLFCERGASHAGTFTAFARDTGIRVDHSDGTGGSVQSIPFTTALAYEIIVDGNTGEASVNDRKFTIPTSEYTTAGPFSLLGAHNAGASLSSSTAMSYTTTCQLYYFRVYDKDGNLQCDLLPAIRTSDSAVGMYDRQRGMFVAGNGSAAFTAGGRATTAKIDNTSDTVSELHINVPSGSFRNVDVPITGNIRLVKEGAGTFVPRKEAQTYSGGTVVSNGLVKVTNSGAAAPLGQGVLYEVLDFIQSSGKQWIYTDYTPECTDKVEMKMEWVSLPSKASTWMGMFCSRGASQTAPYFCVLASGKFRVDHKASGSETGVSYTFSTATPYVISVDGVTGRCCVNDVLKFTAPTDAYTPVGPFSVLGYHDAGADLATKKGTNLSGLPNCKIYSFKVWDKDGNVKCDMVPAIRASDSAIGMYDRERNCFLENYGTADFTPGTVQERVFSGVTVENGAKLEFTSGTYDFCDYSFVLNGGTLKNSVGINSALVSDIRLTADSHWEQTANGGFVGRGDAAALLDLGGRTLTIISENSRYLYFKNLTVTEGTVVFPEHLWFDIASAGGGVNATNATFDISALMRTYGVLSVGNYVARRYAADTAYDPSKFLVYNMLTPVGAPEHLSCTLMDGSTIDFSQATAGLAAATSGGIQFTENATVTVRLGGSRLRNPIVSWTTAPANIGTVTFERDAGESGYKLEVRADGLYAVRKGFVVIVR